MSESTATSIPKEVETMMRRFSDMAQATSEMADEVSRIPVVLDYNRVAARFYEDQIVRLRREVEKYRVLVQSSGFLRAIGVDLIFSDTACVALTPEFRRKMGSPADDEEFIPEEL